MAHQPQMFATGNFRGYSVCQSGAIRAEKLYE